MVALDNIAALGQRRISRIRTVLDGVSLPPVRFALTRFSLVGTITLAAALLVLGTIAINGLDGNAFRLGSQMGWRFTNFVFFAILVTAPLGRLAARFVPAARALEDAAPDLIWGFCASYGVYLLSVLLPNAIHLSMGALVFVLFGAIVISGMALTAAPLRLSYGGTALIGAKVRRTVLGTAVIYFWLCYSLMALERISGPHRPDLFYNVSLLLMIAGLLVRFANRWSVPTEGTAREA